LSTFLLLIFSGANVRLNEMPAWVQADLVCFPLTRGISAARLLVEGAGLADITPLLLGELGVGIVYGILGYLIICGL
jgi:ABC-2 type transport system permease protein